MKIKSKKHFYFIKRLKETFERMIFQKNNFKKTKVYANNYILNYMNKKWKIQKRNYLH